MRTFYNGTKTDTITKNSIHSIATWHAETFPDETLSGQKEKFNEERKEWEDSYDLLELADCWIVACGVSRFKGVDSAICFHYVVEQCMLNAIKFKDLMKAVDNKMEINYHRKWKKSKEGAYRHVG